MAVERNLPIPSDFDKDLLYRGSGILTLKHVHRYAWKLFMTNLFDPRNARHSNIPSQRRTSAAFCSFKSSELDPRNPILPDRIKIGRASWRERGEISGVA